MIWSYKSPMAAAFWLVMGVLGFCVAARGADPVEPHPLSPRVIEADDYFLGRWNPANIRSGIALLRATVAQSPSDYEAWWRLARFLNFQARETEGDAKMELLKQAITAGEKAVMLAPGRVEGYFWLGASEGLYAEEANYWTGIRMIGKVRSEMETAEKLDPNYEGCSAQRTLARIYYRAPFFMGGDKQRSVGLLENCLKRHPDDSLSMLYLAESLYALGRKDQSRGELEKILRLCPNPLYAPEEAQNKAEARKELERRFGERENRQSAAIRSPSHDTGKSEVIASRRQ